MRIPAAGSVAQEARKDGKNTEVLVFGWSHGPGGWGMEQAFPVRKWGVSYVDCMMSRYY